MARVEKEVHAATVSHLPLGSLMQPSCEPRSTLDVAQPPQHFGRPKQALNACEPNEVGEAQAALGCEPRRLASHAQQPRRPMHWQAEAQEEQ